MKEFTMEIKGITLDMCDMCRVHQQYQIYCTAEYLMENYNFDEDMALDLATEVRRLMFKYDVDEDYAIAEVFRNEGINIDEDEEA
jgi:hypothetical protein